MHRVNQADQTFTKMSLNSQEGLHWKQTWIFRNKCQDWRILLKSINEQFTKEQKVYFVWEKIKSWKLVLLLLEKKKNPRTSIMSSCYQLIVQHQWWHTVGGPHFCSYQWCWRKEVLEESAARLFTFNESWITTSPNTKPQCTSGSPDRNKDQELNQSLWSKPVTD